MSSAAFSQQTCKVEALIQIQHYHRPLKSGPLICMCEGFIVYPMPRIRMSGVILILTPLLRDLMHHYTTTVYRLGVRENVVHLWRDYIPQQAVKHPFLLHGLLALAALHLAFLRPEESSQRLQICDKHQAIALEKFRSILSSPIDPTLVDALFALAATLSVSSMARTCTRADTTALDMDTVTELFMLTRGVKDMIHLSFEQIQAGPMAVLLQNQRYPEFAEASLAPSVSACFESIRQMMLSYGLDQSALQACQTALGELQKIYQNIAYISPTGDVELGDVSRWQVLVPIEYIRLIQARNPPALVILSYYAAAMTAIRTAWYTQNWAEFALSAIGQALDGTMQHWLAWPKEQVQDRLAVLGVRPAD